MQKICTKCLSQTPFWTNQFQWIGLMISPILVLPSVRLFVCSFFDCSFLRSSVPLFFRSFVRSFVRSNVLSFIRSLVRSSLRPLGETKKKSFFADMRVFYVRSGGRNNNINITYVLEYGPEYRIYSKERLCSKEPLLEFAPLFDVKYLMSASLE